MEIGRHWSSRLAHIDLVDLAIYFVLRKTDRQDDPLSKITSWGTEFNRANTSKSDPEHPLLHFKAIHDPPFLATNDRPLTDFILGAIRSVVIRSLSPSDYFSISFD